MQPAATLLIRIPRAAFGRFVALFGEGVGIATHTGIPLTAFLCDQLGITAEYIDQRVQTIFVNGRAVDRVETVRIGAGDIIALSAAMPGLVGATLRKGGILAGFRKAISHAENTAASGGDQKTVVTLKLFNLVARELAEQLLQSGVWIAGRQTAAFVQQIDPLTLGGNAALFWNAEPVSADRVSRLTRPDDWIELRVDFLKE